MRRRLQPTTLSKDMARIIEVSELDPYEGSQNPLTQNRFCLRGNSPITNDPP